MKRIVFIILMACGYFAAYAQPSNVQSAWRYLGYKEFDKAKEMIDPAITNDKTKNSSKTWYYRGLIYEGFYDTIKYDVASLTTAVESYKRSLELDKSDYADEIKTRFLIINIEFFQAGMKMYGTKRFDVALKAFQGVILINPTDSGAMKNAAICAWKGNNNALAKEYYAKLIQMNFNDISIYSSLGSLYLEDKDSTKYYETIKAGRTRYPANTDFMNLEVAYLIAANKSNDAIEGLKAILNKNPNDTTMLFALASIYDKLSVDYSKKGDMNEFQKNFSLAEETYKKAIEVKPDYFKANFNLGALYINIAVDMINKANDIPTDKNKEYEAAKAKYEVILRQAKPYFEKALDLQPKDEGTLTALRQLYAHLNMTDKAQEMKKRLEGNK